LKAEVRSLYPPLIPPGFASRNDSLIVCSLVFCVVTGAQADVYREMQALLGADLTRWDAFAPRSNLLVRLLPPRVSSPSLAREPPSQR
jgi:hypothetical protein